MESTLNMIRAPDNCPTDPITMTILGQTKANQGAIIRAAVDELGFGDVDRITAHPVISPGGTVVCQKFVVHYKKWDPLNRGAVVRQTLQNEGKMKIVDNDGTYLWTVSYSCRVKTSKPPPPKAAFPYNDPKRCKKN